MFDSDYKERHEIADQIKKIQEKLNSIQIPNIKMKEKKALITINELFDLVFLELNNDDEEEDYFSPIYFEEEREDPEKEDFEYRHSKKNQEKMRKGLCINCGTLCLNPPKTLDDVRYFERAVDILHGDKDYYLTGLCVECFKAGFYADPIPMSDEEKYRESLKQ